MDWLDIREFIKDTFGYILVVLFILILVIYVVTLEQVVGPSMQSTLNSGDVVVLGKLHYKVFNIKRNDIVSFNYADTKYLIKRVIGLPGETIEYKDNTLYVNGTATEEKFLTVETHDFSLKDLGYETIPDNMYFVLGDNRVDSLDSRTFGLISKDDITGKVMARIWPITGFKLLN